MTQVSRHEKVLVIESDEEVRDELSKTLRLHEFDVDFADDGESGIQALRKGKYAIAIVDLELPGISGVETIAHVAEFSPSTEVIGLAAERNFDVAQQAIRHHIFDCFVKPVSPTRLLRTVREALKEFSIKRGREESLLRLLEERTQLEERIKMAEKAIQLDLNASQLLLGQSEGIRSVRRQIAMVAPSTMTVLILGENGTGKDVVANLIHSYSGRDSVNRMVKVNCPAISESLIESEFFGHEDGAFTGATRRKPGRFDLADGGTIFLDEIATISMPIQAKLLQVVEHKNFTRVGGTEVLHVNARILAATNGDLDTMIKTGDFRADLLYRLKQFVITLPSLRDRREDIPLLIEAFVQRSSLRYGKDNVEIPKGMMEALVHYRWPGNVRELQALIERFVLTGDEMVLRDTIEGAVETAAPAAAVPVVPTGLKETEATAILHALTMANWNRKRAAQDLGISYSAIRRRIEKYDLLNTQASV